MHRWFQQEPVETPRSFDHIRSRMADLINEIGRDQRPLTLNRLSRTIGQRDPVFTPKRYGCKSLSALLVKLGGFTIKRVEGKGGGTSDYTVSAAADSL